MGDLSRNFSRHEFACNCGCGRDTIDYETVRVLEDLRQHYNQVITINSAYRCAAKNTAVGGSTHSQHLYGRAVDFTVAGVHPSDVQDYLKFLYRGKYGIGSYNTFTHVDTRSGTPARWQG